MEKHVPPGSDLSRDPWQGFFRSLPGDIQLAADRGLPVVLRLAEEPAEHTRALMRTLGVEIVIAPDGLHVGGQVSALEHAPATGVPLYCPHTGCSWSFDRGGARGKGYLDVHLRVVHKNAAVPVKASDGPAVLIQPIDSARADGLAALERMDAGERQTPDIAPDTNGGQKAATGSVEPKKEDTKMDTAQGVKRPVTLDDALAAFRRFHDEYGRWPVPLDGAIVDWLPDPRPNKDSAFKKNCGNYGELWLKVGAGKIPWARGVTKYRLTGKPVVASSSSPSSEVPKEEVHGATSSEREPLAHEPPVEPLVADPGSHRPASPEPAMAIVELGSRSEDAAPPEIQDEAPPALSLPELQAAGAIMQTFALALQPLAADSRQRVLTFIDGLLAAAGDVQLMRGEVRT